MKKITTMLVLIFAMCATSLFAQTRSISGTVTSDDDNLPLIGVAVMVEGTGDGSVTDFNGKFTIADVNGAVTLVLTHLGLQSKTIAVSASQSIVNVSLSWDSVNLDEVVVTGLGISREKKALGYAVQEVDGKEFSQVRTGNFINSLSGRAPGVQVTSSSGQLGGGAKINIRGNTSLFGNNQPLFVIDGSPISNADYTDSGTREGYNQGNLAGDISPDDIESMTILKGASATALYGSRGANGVILITTKKGKHGEKTFGVSVNSSVTLDRVGILPEYQKLYGGGYSTTFPTANIDGKEYNVVEYYADESWGPKYSSNLMSLPWNAFDKWDTENYMIETPWLYPENDYTTYFNTGVSLNNNISVSGSDENYSYRLSYSNLDQTGITDNSRLKRNNFSFSGTAKMNKYIDSWVNATYVKTDVVGRQENGYGDNNTTKTMFQWTQTQLDYDDLRAYKNPDGSQRSWNRKAWNNGAPLFNDNPYWTLNENYENDTRNRFYGNTGVNITPIEGLKITGRIGIDMFSYQVEERAAMGSRAISDYMIIDRQNVELNMDFMVSYNKRFAEDQIGISALVGATSNDQNYHYTGGETVSGLLIPGVYNLSNSVAKADVYDYKRRSRINSIYGNATIDWNRTIYLDVTARNDWSSTLPAENRSYFYPSVNLSFILSEIGGLDDLSWLSFAKIRGGYAQVGNATSAYNLQNYYSVSTPFGADPMYYISTTLNNSELRPEKTSSWEIGLEAQFLNHRLGFDLAYYQKTTTDQIIPASISAVTGYLNRYINAGELYNAGVELTVNATPILASSSGGFQWDAVVNLATYKNEVISIAPGIDYLELGENGFSQSIGAVVGSSYPVIYGKDYLYGENGEKLVNEEGRYLSSSGNEDLGKVTPDFTLGFSNSFSWRGIDVSILFDMQMGGHIYYMTNKYGMYSGILAESAMQTNVPGKTGDIREDGYIIPNTVYGHRVYDTEKKEYVNKYITADGGESTTAVNNASVITGQQYSQDFSNGPQAQNVFKSDFIKLREVRIGYTFPNKLTGPIKNIRLSAFGRNLATFMTDQDHFDPEYTTMAGSNAQGLEGGYVPTTMSFGFSLGFKF